MPKVNNLCWGRRNPVEGGSATLPINLVSPTTTTFPTEDPQLPFWKGDPQVATGSELVFAFHPRTQSPMVVHESPQYIVVDESPRYALQDTVWVERHHKDVLSRHRQASWYVPGVIVRKVGQDVYAVRVGDNKILDRDHTQLRPRAPDPSRRPVTFEFTAGDVDSDDEGEDDDFTAEKILADKPDPGTPGGRLYKVRWKECAASRDSWEPPSSFVPRYTTVWMDYLKKKNISLNVKDVLVHFVAAVAP